MKKKYLTILLVVLLVLPLYTLSASAVYSTNWWEWSQKYTGLTGDYYEKLNGDNAIQLGACRIVAQCKLLAESGVIDSGEFDPDDYTLWLEDNGYIVGRKNGEYFVGETKASGSGMIAFAATKGATITRVENNKYIGGMSLQEQKEMIMDYLRQGYFVIVAGSNHQAYIMQYNSLYYNTPHMSNSGHGIGLNTMNREYDGKYYSSSNDKFTNIYVYAVSTSEPIPPQTSVTVTTGSAENITDTSAVLYGSATASNTVITETGMYIGSSKNSMVKLGSDSISGTAPSMWYDTNKYGYVLEPTTLYYYRAYVVAGGQIYWGEIKSFFTSGSFSGEKLILTYNGMGGSNVPGRQSIITSQDVTSHTYTVSNVIPEQSGYDFLGWSIEKETSKVHFMPNDQITITEDTMLYAVWSKNPATIVKINYKDETIDVRASMQWLDDMQNGNKTTAMWDETIHIEKQDMSSYRMYFGNTIYIREYLDGSYGEWNTLVIPQRPSEPQAVTLQNNCIVGVTDAMEYRYGGLQEWISCKNGSIPCLINGTYEIRYKATLNAFASEAVTFSVENTTAPTYQLEITAPLYMEAYCGYVQPEAKAIRIKNTGNMPVEISSVTVDQSYFKISGYGEAIDVGDTIYTWMVQPISGLKVGKYKATITVMYDNGNIVTDDVLFEVLEDEKDSSEELQTYPPIIKGDKYGNVIVTPKAPNSGDIVTIFLEPATGYELDRITVIDSKGEQLMTDAKNDGSWTFVQPSNRVTISVAFKKVISEGIPFEDVASGAWYKEAVNYVYFNEIMCGFSEKVFAPDQVLSRAQLAQILYNMEGQPSTSGELHFLDVSKDAWYLDAVVWAAEKGIVKGYSLEKFGAEDSITREQLAAMLYRYASYKRYDLSYEEDILKHYHDCDELSSWAATPMQWAVSTGIVSGIGRNVLSPGGNATRAQAAVMLMRFVENVVE